LHAALQYLTILHLLHMLRLPPSLPHEAQLAVEVSLDAMVHVFVFYVNVTFVLLIRGLDCTFLLCE
jgi:hypothetical protein